MMGTAIRADEIMADRTLGYPWGRRALVNQLRRVATATEGSRHDTLYRACCSLGGLVGGGELFSRARIAAMMIQSGVALGMVRHDAAHQVERGLTFGERHPRQPPDTQRLRNSTDARAEVASWWASAAADATLASTSLKVLAGVERIASRAGKVRFAASVRQIAGTAGVSTSTVSKHLPRLDQWLSVVERGNRVTGQAAVFQLRTGRAVTNTSLNPEDGNTSDVFANARVVSGAYPNVPSANTWHRWPNGWRLYQLLSVDEPQTVANLATLAGASIGGTRRNLGKLHDRGSATQHPHGWLRIEGADELPGFDWADARRQRHALDRNLHRMWLHEHIARQRREIVC